MDNRKNPHGPGRVFSTVKAGQILLLGFLVLFIFSGCAIKKDTLDTASDTDSQDVYAVDLDDDPGIDGLDATKSTAADDALLVARDKEKAQALLAARQGFESRMIYFDFDSAVLTPEAQDVLRENARFLYKNPRVQVRIAGYCDDRGSTEYNLALGERRALAAKKFLVHLNVFADRISTISYGKENPIDPGKNEQAWAKNRRAEFHIR